jgi:YjjW family glycine radical enzyme activase
MSEVGLVADIIRFSSVDGPGNRFVVFLQGCNFNCIACHNPYTINVCNNCGECVQVCEAGALSLSPIGTVMWDANACTGSDRCTAWCPFDSTPKAMSTTVAELVDKVRGPAPFLSGVTVSGGEATQQTPFVRAFFAALAADVKLSRLTRFVDSNGAAPARVWHELAPLMDGAMIDLKAFDNETHLSMTGQPNDEVLESIRLLVSLGKLAEVRLLLLPGINDQPEVLARTGAWLYDVDPTMRIKIIGFRCHGVRANERLRNEPDSRALAVYADIIRAQGLTDLIVV